MQEPQLYDPPQRSSINVGQDERTLSLFGGAGLLYFAMMRHNPFRVPALLAGFALLYQGATGNSLLYRLIDRNTAVRSNPKAVSVPHQQGIHVTRAVTINRPVADLYNFWHDPTNFPEVMNYIDSVQVTGDKRAHWTVKAPGGAKFDFDVEVYTDTPNEVISWRSLPESQIQNAGSVRFNPAPNGLGTEVHLTVDFVPPGGPIGQRLLKMFGDVPNQYIAQYLREFKQMMETGEKATTQGQTSGRVEEVRQ